MDKTHHTDAEAMFPVRFDSAINEEQRLTDMPSQMRSLSRLLEMKAMRSPAQEEAELTKDPPDITREDR